MISTSLQGFIDKVHQDPDLQARLNADGADPVAIAKEEGFDFSLEEFQTFSHSLSHEELEAISGGLGGLADAGCKNNSCLGQSLYYGGLGVGGGPFGLEPGPIINPPGR